MSRSTSGQPQKRNTRNDGLMHHDKTGRHIHGSVLQKNGARKPSGRPPRPPKK